MRAVVYHEPGRVAYEQVADPVLSANDEAIVRVTLAGLCGSDLHIYRGAERGLDDGTVMGHELVGEIVEVGRDVSGLRPGDRVASPFSTSCGRCFFCHQGLTARCEHGQLFGWVEAGRGLHGAQAQYVRIPLADSTLVRVPAEVDDLTALFCGDILATGTFCVDLGDPAPGSTIVILGCGPVGLMAILAARQRQVAHILAVDPVPERLRLAESFGASPVDPGSEGPLEAALALTAGRGADVVIELAGTTTATRLAVDLLRPGGTLVVGAVHTESQLPFSPATAYEKNLTYRTGRCPARRYLERLLTTARPLRVELDTLVSHDLPLAEAAHAYDIFDRKLESCTKVVLRP